MCDVAAQPAGSAAIGMQPSSRSHSSNSLVWCFVSFNIKSE